MKYYSIHEFSKLIGRTPQTLRNWDKSGKLKPNHTGANGYRYYSHQQLNELLGITDLSRKIIGYCRVSSNKQKDDLERQVDSMEKYLQSLNCEYEIIQDIGSGINYTKKGLRNLLKKINSKEISKIVVFYKDRLLRFGFELVEYMANLNGCEIEVLDSTEKSEQEELVEDLVQIVTVFSCKLQGRCANKTRKLVEELTQESEVAE
ncbi:MAG: IS607 family transposase [Clostridiales bacterium]|jgi:predicted site-specific integrase-resolvase|nr:IS607 family transposase [Clostridiales bacterium]